MSRIASLLCLLLALSFTTAFLHTSVRQPQRHHGFRSCARRPSSALRMSTDLKEKETPDAAPEAVTEKYGLEAGLFSVMKSGGQNRGQQAKELLKRYGGAYLITSISFALVSFSICYVLVDSGVDVAALLNKVGIDATATTEKAGTFAIAYAAHKAASPIRFPPTVALTPVVAKFLGKKVDETADADSE
eukprot:TRINITY_DN29283_c0_g1_i1.p2 TRINITY_DN29283_c0_g1~~TRINITY_DN29283_c0_g1_i1.p2  ORF type:complete len:189 (-),score=52.38 TRINITY_DN29283_c0_g1_i1:363-929(-)